MDVAGADNSDIVGNPQTRFQNGFYRPRRYRVVIAEHAIGRRIQLEQLAHRLITRAVTVLPTDDVFRRRFESMLG